MTFNSSLRDSIVAHWLLRSMLHVSGTVLFLVLAGSVVAQESAKASADATDADVLAIHKSANAFAKAFQQQNAKAIAKLWTSEGIYVDAAGREHRGRQAIQEAYRDFFKTIEKGTEIHIEIDSIRAVTPNVAIETGSGTLSPAPIGPPGSSDYIAVHVKQDDGKWLLDSVRDSRVEIPSTYNKLMHLELLVGKWHADHNNTQVTLSGRWNPNKSYLQRRFEVTRNGSTSTSTEIIGWDPLTGEVTSWTFSNDGARSVGTWTPLSDGWLVRHSGVNADGRTTSSVDLWAPLLDGALGWRSTERSVGGGPLLEPTPVVLKKTSPDSANR